MPYMRPKLRRDLKHCCAVAAAAVAICCLRALLDMHCIWWHYYTDIKEFDMLGLLSTRGISPNMKSAQLALE